MGLSRWLSVQHREWLSAKGTSAQSMLSGASLNILYATIWSNHCCIDHLNLTVVPFQLISIWQMMPRCIPSFEAALLTNSQQGFINAVTTVLSVWQTTRTPAICIGDPSAMDALPVNSVNTVSPATPQIQQPPPQHLVQPQHIVLVVPGSPPITMRLITVRCPL